MSRAIVEFGSEHTFKVEGEIVKPGTLFNGQIVQIHGQRGEYKVVKKEFGKNKLIIKCEKMPDYQFKVHHKKLKETFGVEAVSGRGEPGPTEYLISVKGKKRWVEAFDCSAAEPKPI